MGQAEWYRRSFAEDYLRIYRHRDLGEAERVLEQLLALVPLGAGPRCLDLCCGAGRHLAVLRNHGLDVYGVDLSAPLLTAAQELVATADRLIRADMRRLPFWQAFDFVFSFFTSFGYFRADAENEAVFHQINKVLRPGGGFLFDFLNASREYRSLIPQDIRHTPDFTLTQRRWIDIVNSSIDKSLTIEDSFGSRTYQESVKLYGPNEFLAFAEAAGLVIDRFCGAADGRPFTPDAPRLIVIGHKPPLDIA